MVQSCPRVVQEVHGRDSKVPWKCLGVFTSEVAHKYSEMAKRCSGVAQKYFEVAQRCSDLGWFRVNLTGVVQRYQEVVQQSSRMVQRCS